MTSVLDAYSKWEQQKSDETVRECLPMVYRLGQRIANVTNLGTLELGDLVNAGVLGLYRAFERFDVTRGVPFISYAVLHVRGAMLDEIQRYRQIPRSLRDKHNRIRAAYDELAQANLRSPTDHEVANYLGISEQLLSAWLVDVGWTTIWSVDELESLGVLDPVDESPQNNPSDSYDAEESKSVLTDAIKRLSLKEQQVLYAYYQEELTLKEIAYVVGLSESQISRIHSKAILRLRGMMSRQKSDVLLDL
ncbi:sigma-70 family RNA polymerase sigma factor [Alicyclobacillus mengziensis]|uniref:Sigma-70 family RNA polymerase sigma factor n=1 Tax=Alicyclobacillus mengziensis TaxID=2931921 RepID=A0A9X7Z8C7_9BACL|nr:sigma-70 family RNA polymerase sigma factor [Alicyclobacillus mengziensis]QSO48138.1 sigma-70 family RNA polymerase sigma factor [Alicyclobacillus mengziensis]